MIDDEKLDTIRDLTKFAPAFFIIRSKAGMPSQFVLNRAQLYIHERIEAQRKATGKVRAVILKGRQQGCSTYIQARYFHKVITSRGKKAFILTHEADATKNLFEMTKRFYDNLEAGLCPKADTSSIKELHFSQFDSGYAVGTAGNKGVGRSQTIQLFHGSEVAFWQYADEHAKGVLQAVSDEGGTEIILESTANGIGNYFHGRWVSASGAIDSDYQAIFVPWYWQPEYTMTVEGFSPNEEEQELLSHHAADGLTLSHLAWRRRKINNLSKDFEAGLELFKQEYPFTANEAFLNPIDNVFINSRYVMQARRADVDSTNALIIGVDVAIGDRDRTAIIRRRGRVAYNLEKFGNHNTMEICGRLVRVIREEKPARVYIDCIGIGAGVVDRLQEMGYDCVIGVNVARTANDKEKYRNVRAELWAEMRDWLNQEMPVQIPDSDDLHGELCSLGYKFTSSGQLQIESKDDLRARGMASPDGADALALTFFGGFHDTHTQIPVVVRPAHERGMFT
jgi:hypothetical protein